MKIDVEGFEINGILNFSNTIYLVEVRKETKDIIFDIFMTKNFKCFLVDEDLKEITSKKCIPDFSNLIFLPKE